MELEVYLAENNNKELQVHKVLNTERTRQNTIK